MWQFPSRKPPAAWANVSSLGSSAQDRPTARYPRRDRGRSTPRSRPARAELAEAEKPGVEVRRGPLCASGGGVVPASIPTARAEASKANESRRLATWCRRLQNHDFVSGWQAEGIANGPAVKSLRPGWWRSDERARQGRRVRQSRRVPRARRSSRSASGAGDGTGLPMGCAGFAALASSPARALTPKHPGSFGSNLLCGSRLPPSSSSRTCSFDSRWRSTAGRRGSCCSSARSRSSSSSGRSPCRTSRSRGVALGRLRHLSRRVRRSLVGALRCERVAPLERGARATDGRPPPDAAALGCCRCPDDRARPRRVDDATPTRPCRRPPACSRP